MSGWSSSFFLKVLRSWRTRRKGFLGWEEEGAVKRSRVVEKSSKLKISKSSMFGEGRSKGKVSG